MKRHISIAVACFIVSALLEGCVSTKVSAFQRDNTGKVTETKDVGFQFREALPYLLVTSEVVISQATTFYTYDSKFGFIPVCDQPVTGKDSLQARGACLALQREIKKLGTTSPSGASDPIVRDDAGFVLASQRLQTVAALAADSKPAHPPKGAAAEPPSQADIDAKIKAELAAAKAADNAKKADPKTQDSPTKGADTAQQGAIQIVYLPSPCRIYAVRQTNFLSTAKLNLALTNGWQLTTVGVETDSTAVVGKLLDTAGAVMGAQKGGSAGGAAKGGGGATAQGLTEDLYARTETRYIEPGLYPLAKCTTSGDGFDLKMSEIPRVSKVEWAIAFPKAAK